MQTVAQSRLPDVFFHKRLCLYLFNSRVRRSAQYKAAAKTANAVTTTTNHMRSRGMVCAPSIRRGKRARSPQPGLDLCQFAASARWPARSLVASGLCKSVGYSSRNPCMQTGLRRMRTESLAAPPRGPGSGFRAPETEGRKLALSSPSSLQRLEAGLFAPAKLRVFGERQEISFSAGVRGGPARTRTSIQSVMSSLRRRSQQPEAADLLAMLGHRIRGR